MTKSRLGKSRQSTAMGLIATLISIAGLSFMALAYFGIRDAMPKQAQPHVANYVSYESAPLDTRRKISEIRAPKHSLPKKIDVDKSSKSVDNSIGTITFPSLKMSWPIYQGTDDAPLAKGVGHYIKSVMPGKADNSVLAGHRETVFNRLGELKFGQRIFVSTSDGVFEYKIRKFRIVERSDRTVIVPTPKAVLTLVTCYPFNYFGITHKTFVVVADLVNSEKAIR